MHGNVAEWCLGEYHPTYDGAPNDGRPWISDGDTDRHVLRGGSWDDLAIDCRSANRYSYPREGRQSTIGFRLAMSMESPTKAADVAEAPAADADAAPPPPQPLAARDPSVPRNDPRVAHPPRWTDRPAAARVLRRRFPGDPPAGGQR
jgi:sulfatase-modifying factor enzyme 1